MVFLPHICKSRFRGWRNVFNWGVDIDCDCITEKSQPFPEAAIEHANQLRERRVDCADLTAIRGEREAK